jgi:hypothetical protein
LNNKQPAGNKGLENEICCKFGSQSSKVYWEGKEEERRRNKNGLPIVFLALRNPIYFNEKFFHYD